MALIYCKTTLKIQGPWLALAHRHPSDHQESQEMALHWLLGSSLSWPVLAVKPWASYWVWCFSVDWLGSLQTKSGSSREPSPHHPTPPRYFHSHPSRFLVSPSWRSQPEPSAPCPRAWETMSSWFCPTRLCTPVSGWCSEGSQAQICGFWPSSQSQLGVGEDVSSQCWGSSSAPFPTQEQGRGMGLVWCPWTLVACGQKPQCRHVAGACSTGASWTSKSPQGSIWLIWLVPLSSNIHSWLWSWTNPDLSSVPALKLRVRTLWVMELDPG